MRSSRCLSTIGQAFSCLSLDQYSMLKRKKLLVSCSSPGLFGLPEKLQGTVTYIVKAGLLHGHFLTIPPKVKFRKNTGEHDKCGRTRRVLPCCSQASPYVLQAPGTCNCR